MTNEYENATPLDIQLSSGWPEVDAVVDAIFAECVADAGIQRQYPRMKTCLKVVLMNLFTCHVSDPTRYIRYSRRNASFTKSYNCLELSPEQIRKAVDNLAKLKYVTGELGKWSFIAEGRRQSRVRAEQSLIQRIMEFRVSPLMAAIDPDANLIVLKDSDKNWLEIEPTNVTHRMQEELKRINAILSVTMINLYMTDKELHVLNERLRTGKIP
nr:hypothetical protein [Pseudomonadota bacterium]